MRQIQSAPAGYTDFGTLRSRFAIFNRTGTRNMRQIQSAPAGYRTRPSYVLVTQARYS